MMTPAAAYLGDVRDQFRKMKELAERAIAQASDEDLARRLDPESNSIGLVMKHMAGNLRSRFTDFLTSDGEKATRDRDAEFEEDGAISRTSAIADWDSGWRTLFGALDALTPDDLLRDVYIRGEHVDRSAY